MRMNQLPNKVTVIIPSYNHRDYVIQAIESVMQQDWPNIELIVIDNNSTDGSLDLIRQHNAKNPHYQFLVNKQQGLISSLNLGLELANGDYFCELASDDWLPVNSIQERVTYLLDHPNQTAVFTDAYTVDQNTVTDRLILRDKHKAPHSKSDIFPDLINCKGPFFATGLIKTPELRKAGGFNSDLRYYEDLDTPIRIALQGPMGFLDQPLFYRRTHRSNTSTSTHHIRKEKVIFYQSLLTIKDLQPYNDLIKQRLKKSILDYGKHLAQQSTIPKSDAEHFFSLNKYSLANPKHLMRSALIYWRSKQALNHQV